MRPFRMMACALLLAAASAAAQNQAVPTATAATQAGDLAGLWKAKRRFGPDVAGPLIVTRAGTGYAADIAGQVVPVRVENGELRFELPGDRGRFQGRFDGNAVIRGHWIRPQTPANLSRYASPVLLRAAGRNRWSGDVQILQDEFTFYLLAQRQPDGSLATVLRNPERDLGTQLGARRIVLEGDVVRLMGGRRNQAERELARGAYDPENDSFTLHFPNRGGAYDFSRDGDDSDFYPRGRTPSRYAYRPPLARDDGWPTGTLADAGIDRAAMERLVQRIVDMPMTSAAAPQVHGLLIARHGRLVLEEYFHGFDRDRLHDTRSAAKSVTSTLVGAAIESGAPLSVASPVYQVMNGGAFPAGLEPRKRAMRLEHLLTMSSGYFCDDGNDEAPGNENRMADQTEEPDYYRYTLAVPMITAPGERAVYCSANPNLALGMVGRATGQSPIALFDRLIGTPLNIRRYAWILDPAGQAYGGGSLQLLPRDFMKFGQLMLNGGTWHGRRILGRDYVASASAPLFHLSNITYGYFWWGEDYPYRNRTVRSFSARGAGGQMVTVIPELDLVVTVLGGNYASLAGVTEIEALVPRSILPAVRERGDDPNAPVSDRAFTSPYGLSPDGSPIPRTR